MSTQRERDAAYTARCCDWHFGTDSGRGASNQPCQNPRRTMVPLCPACGSRRCPAALDSFMTCANSVQIAINTLTAFIDCMPSHPGYGTQPHVEATAALAVLVQALGKVR